MKALGVTDHRFLGGAGRYRDSGMMWHEDGHAIAGDDVQDGTFWRADLSRGRRPCWSRSIREVRPQVLVTYDQFGGYGHPDHIQAHRVAMYAAALAAVPSYRPDLGEPWDIAKIYWGAMSESRMRERAAARCARPATPPPSRAWTPTGRCRRSSCPTTCSRRSSTARDHVEAKMARDARARHPDRGRRPVLRAVEQPRQPGVGHRVLPARQGHAGADERRRPRDRPVRRVCERAAAAHARGACCLGGSSPAGRGRRAPIRRRPGSAAGVPATS